MNRLHMEASSKASHISCGTQTSNATHNEEDLEPVVAKHTSKHQAVFRHFRHTGRREFVRRLSQGWVLCQK